MINSYPHLCGILKYTLKEISEILDKKENYYYHFRQPKGLVKGVEKFRIFDPSKKDLRDLQNRIHTKIFQKITFPLHVNGCVKRRGNVTNTKPHQGKLYRFKTDLKAYFEFVSNKKVYDALCKQGFSQKVSHTLTELTTYKGHLPQGTPTSPFLANLVGLAMDDELLKICKAHQITYTRFVDDLFFSSENDFKVLVPEFIRIINEHGFLIGYKKTKYKLGRIEVTGVNIGQNLLRPTKHQMTKYNNPETPDHTRKGLDIYFAGLKK